MKETSVIKAHIRGNLIAVILTLVAVLVFAFIVRAAGFTSGTVGMIAQIIKVVSIFLGVFIVLRRTSGRAWLHGAIVGLVYTVIAFFIFSIIDSNFSITSGLMLDALFALIVGVVSAVLLRLKKRAI